MCKGSFWRSRKRGGPRQLPGRCSSVETASHPDRPWWCLPLAQDRGFGRHPGAPRHTRQAGGDSCGSPDACLFLETVISLRRGLRNAFWPAGVCFPLRKTSNGSQHRIPGCSCELGARGVLGFARLEPPR